MDKILIGFALVNILLSCMVLISIKSLNNSLDNQYPTIEYDDNNIINSSNPEYDIILNEYKKTLVPPQEYIQKMIENEDGEGVEVITNAQEKAIANKYR